MCETVNYSGQFLFYLLPPGLFPHEDVAVKDMPLGQGAEKKEGTLLQRSTSEDAGY